MSFLLHLAMVYAALVLETAPWVRHGLPLPSGLWLAAAAFVWMRPGPQAVFWCSGLGLIWDGLGSGPLGIGVAAGAVWGWIGSDIRLRWRLDSVPAFFLLTCLQTAAVLVTAEPIRRLFRHVAAVDAALLRQIVERASLTGLLGGLLFVLLRSFLPRPAAESAF